ncbi:MAG: shikimate dehydrogenase [Mariprofundaceae bacterium]|nr:shikimate dehydrogenase [Mariprofundaceae bacterium]
MKVLVSGNTKVFGIIGDPVSHSLSPLFQSRFLDQSGIDALYAPFCVREDDVVRALEGLWAAGVEGLNVTVPHKEMVLRQVDADADAMCIGAVNTVRRGVSGWQGTNTDWRGFRDMLHGMGMDVGGTEVFLFGAGGTARAVLHALAQEKVKKISICNRGEDRLRALIRHAREAYPELAVAAVAWNQAAVAKACDRVVLMVNTTSIGLAGKDEDFPFRLSGDGVALDAVYAQDGNTAFVCAAEKAGRKAMDGLPMLLAQGVSSFYYWHSIEPARMTVLRWLEARLGREHADLPGWEEGL